MANNLANGKWEMESVECLMGEAGALLVAAAG